MTRNLVKSSTLAALSTAMLITLTGMASPAMAAPNDELTPKPPEMGPDVWWDPPALGGLIAHIRDRSGVASQCTYEAEPTVRRDNENYGAGARYARSFFLPANSISDLRIFPAIPLQREWFVTITCDNGTRTDASTFF